MDARLARVIEVDVSSIRASLWLVIMVRLASGRLVGVGRRIVIVVVIMSSMLRRSTECVIVIILCRLVHASSKRVIVVLCIVIASVIVAIMMSIVVLESRTTRGMVTVEAARVSMGLIVEVLSWSMVVLVVMVITVLVVVVGMAWSSVA